MKVLMRIFLLSLLTFFLFSCATNPVTGKNELHLVSQSQEISIGQNQYAPLKQMEGGKYTIDPNISVYVQSVGNKLAAVSDRPDLPYEFTVLDNDVPNAWALPGGKISINRGLLTELDNEAELAAVLAHEIVHAAARHGAQTIERGMVIQGVVLGTGLATSGMEGSEVIVGAAALGGALINQKYGRGAELEADKYGIRYMSRAGYDPQAAVTLQEKFVKLSKGRKSSWFEGLFASHPPSEERVIANQKTALEYPRGGYLGVNNYKQATAILKKTEPAYQYLAQGKQALSNNQPSQALTLANQAIAIEPKEGSFYLLKGEAYRDLGDNQNAMDAFNTAIRLKPSFYQNYLQRGLLNRELRKDSKALRDLKKSTRLLPTSVAYLKIGEIQLDRGNKYQAIKAFQFASQDTETQYGQKALEWINRLESK
jgi:predicted Zn-dependent protease